MMMRNPYVGAGADGARRSAEIDRSEADGLDRTDPRRDELLASAERWEEQARTLADDAEPDWAALDWEPDPDLQAAQAAAAPALDETARRIRRLYGVDAVKPASEVAVTYPGPDGAETVTVPASYVPEGAGASLASAVITDPGGAEIWRGPDAPAYVMPAGDPPPATMLVTLEAARADAARDLLLQRHLKAMQAAAETKKRARVDELFTLAGQKEPAELDGVRLGEVRYDRGSSSWTVTDAGAFLAWVTEHQPDKVEELVPADEWPRIVARVQAVVDIGRQVTQVVASLADLEDALKPQRVDYRVAPTFEALVLKAARSKGGTVTSKATGEDVLARSVPGVELVKAADKVVVSVAKDEDGEAAQLAILRRLGDAAAQLGIDAGALGLELEKGPA